MNKIGITFFEKIFFPEKSLQRKIVYTAYRLWESLSSDGVHTTFQKIIYRFKYGKFLVKEKYSQGVDRDPDLVYEKWRRKNELTKTSLAEMHQRSLQFKYRPLISIVIPTYKPDIPFLKQAIESILNQCYPDWQLCICDDGSKTSDHKRILENYRKNDPRIILRFEEKNEGIISASQKASSLARGEFIAFMDQDDLLSPDALFRVAEKLNKSPDLDLLYSDNDKVDLYEVHREVYFKPDFSPDEFFCHNYIGHLSVLRKKIFDDIGGFVPGFDGAQDFEILLRAIEKSEKVAHLPYVLYSWRKTPGSTASSPQAKHYAYESGKKALESYFKRKRMDARVEEPEERGLYRCRFSIPKQTRVSIIIVSSSGVPLTRCLESLILRSSYKNYEIVVVDRGIDEESSKKITGFHQLHKVTVQNNLSMINAFNEGARHSQGDSFIFLSDATETIQSDWIESLLEPIQRMTVGAVGAKILYPDRTIEHGGVILGLGDLMDHAFKGVPDDAILYNQPHRLIRNSSAVSGDCLLTSSRVFNELKGFDERFSSSYGDIDFCLRLREHGYWIVWTPFATLLSTKIEGQNRSHSPRDKRIFQERWKETLSKPDPFYNVNQSRKYFDFSPDVE